MTFISQSCSGRERERAQVLPPCPQRREEEKAEPPASSVAAKKGCFLRERRWRKEFILHSAIKKMGGAQLIWK